MHNAQSDLERQQMADRLAKLSKANADLKAEIMERWRAEQDHRQVSEVLNALIHVSPLAVALLDPDLTVRKWNPAAERLFGWAAPEVIGRRYPLVPEDRQEEFRLRYAMVERGETFSGFETYRRRKDGSEVPVSISVAPLHDAKGAMRAIVAFLEDITERRRLEADRERSADKIRRLQAVTDAALAHLGIQDLPQELLRRIRGALDADTAAVLLLNEAGDHLVLVAAEGLQEDVPQDLRIPVGSGFAGAIAARLEPMMVSDVSQVEGLSQFFRSSVRSLLGIPMVLEDRVIGVVQVGTVKGRDWTDGDVELLRLVADRLALVFQHRQLYVRERQARSAAEAAEQRSTFLANASKLLASTLDYEATLKSVALLAIPALADWCVVDVLQEDQSIRRMAATHVDSAMEERLRAAGERYPIRLDTPHPIAMVMRTGQAEVIPEITDSLLAAIAQDAQHLELLRSLEPRSLMVVPLQARGRILGAISFCSRRQGRRYGPTELALAEDLALRAALAVDNARLYREVQEADRRKDEFMTILAHELRNPLEPMVNALHVMEDAGASEEEDSRMRAIVARQTRHLARVVDALLDVARIRTGKITLQREGVDLRDVARHCLETLQASGKARLHDVSLSLTAEPVVIEGDPMRLEQALGNLLDNAVKFSPPGASIRLSVDRDAGQAVIRVQDRGAGIAPEMVGRIFEPYHQVQATPDRPHGGLGLGLTLVRALVERHGGSVTGRSAGPGQGSEFTVQLPLLRVDEPGTIQAAPAVTSVPRRILIVDDHEDSRASLRVLLEMAGHHVAEAKDGPGAVSTALAFWPEVAFIDIGMPDMDGYEVARQIRAVPKGREMVLVALTGYGEPEDRKRARRAGFDGHLLKPVEPDRLAYVLATAVAQEQPAA
jgi:PAS domain S-box-containing protein